MQGTLLFDPDAPTVRGHDPVTSRQTPSPLGRNKGCAEVLVIIAAAGDRGATCADVLHEMAAGTDRANTSRRITDLVHAGLIERRDLPPRARRGGRPQQINHVTPNGLAAIAHARQILAGSSAEIVARPTPSGDGLSRVAGQGHAQERRALPCPPTGSEPGTAAMAGHPHNEHDPRRHPGAGSHDPERDHSGSDRTELTGPRTREYP